MGARVGTNRRRIEAVNEPELLPPTVDADERKLAFRHVVARNAASSRTDVAIRDTGGLVIDEPAERGGTNAGPTPVETVIAALCGCDAVITHAVAEIMKFDYAGLEYQGESVVDVRGSHGVVGIRPYFETLTVNITIYTDETPERLAKLEKNVSQRCPVSNLVRDAGVDLTLERTIRPASEYQAAAE
jgi:putative redox protein